METRYFFSKSLRLIVKKTDDESQLEVLDYSTGEKFLNAGMLIKGFGTDVNKTDCKEQFWKHCIDKEQFDLCIEKHRYSQTKEFKEKKERQLEEKTKSLILKYENDFNELKKEKYPIPTTYENIRVVLRYLNTKNWGSWDLPKMTISYSAHQYDCDGKIASTIKLDEPIDYYGEKETKFVVGAPFGHLTQYKRL